MDTDLVIRAQRGDKEAFALVATEHRRSVPRRGAQDPARPRPRRGRDAAGAAGHLAGPPAAPRPGPLRGLVVPAPRARLLRRGPEGRVTGRRTSACCRSIEPIADDDLSSVVDRDQLERGFRRLSIDHRAVVVLHHYLDLPLDRVAEILGVPTGTAHSRLHHAMRGLRAALDADARPASARRLPNEYRSDTTRIVRSWLRMDEHESADRVLDVVLDSLDATPQRRPWWPARRIARDELPTPSSPSRPLPSWRSRSLASTCYQPVAIPRSVAPP